MDYNHAFQSFFDKNIKNLCGNEAPKRTLQPSHLFFTELIVFIPLAWSAILLCVSPSLTPFITAGRLKICVCVVKEDKHLKLAAIFEVVVVGVRRADGSSTRAVRRNVVVGIILCGSIGLLIKSAEVIKDRGKEFVGTRGCGSIQCLQVRSSRFRYGLVSYSRDSFITPLPFF
jgi:hypothetical protein